MDVATGFQAVSQFFADNKEMLTILIGGAGGLLALWQYRSDQSWKKMQFAYDYAERVLVDPTAVLALRMLDWESGIIPEGQAKQYGIADADRSWTQTEVARALRPHDAGQALVSDGEGPDGSNFSRKEQLIRELFDLTLAYFERLGHFLQTRVISADDFPTTLAYYPKIMGEPRSAAIYPALQKYMERYGFDHAKHLFEALA